jgi:hypothetical protein
MQISKLLDNVSEDGAGTALKCMTSPFDEGKNAIAVFDVSGFEGAVKLQSSDDNSTWADVSTLAGNGGVSQALVAGGAAGDFTVDGIKVTDRLLAVIHNTAGTLVDLTSEFTISAADTINNADGTDTTNDDLLVLWESPGGSQSTHVSVVLKRFMRGNVTTYVAGQVSLSLMA